MKTPRKLWMLLTSGQRRAAGVQLGLMLMGMVLETVGIGLVIPALALMTQGDLAARYPSMAPWLARFGNPSHEKLVVAGMLALVAVCIIKALFLGFLAWRQAHFVFGLQASLSQRLFTSYLRQPYTFHLQRNSAQLIRNTIGQVTDLANVIQQGLILLTEILVLTGISVLLLVVEPLGAVMVVSTLGLAAWAFNHATRRYIVRWGAARQHHEGLRIQHLQQGLGGAKDVKLLGREDDFLNQYREHNVGSARAAEVQATIAAFPRLWLELLGVTGLAALVIVMIGRGKPLDALLPTLGLFAAAAFRLMPSVNRVLGALQSEGFSLPAIDTLHSELSHLDATSAMNRGEPLAFSKSLDLDRVVFSYPACESQALKSVSLSIPRGATVGFVGGSGAGKSTLVDIILGLLTPETGKVSVDGVDIQLRLRSWQDQIGYVPQSIYLSDDTLRRNVAFGLADSEIDDTAVARAIRAAQLQQFVNELPKGVETLVGERGVRLSGGQRQRIGIARALYHDPSVLMLDEATSSLDLETEKGVMEAVRALHGDKTIIIVAHRLSTVEHCDRLFRLEQGMLVKEGESAAVIGDIHERLGSLE